MGCCLFFYGFFLKSDFITFFYISFFFFWNCLYIYPLKQYNIIEFDFACTYILQYNKEYNAFLIAMVMKVLTMTEYISKNK